MNRSPLSPLDQRYQQAAHAHKLGEIKQAVQIYQEILHHSPTHPGALNGMGVIIMQQGDKQKALEAFKQAVASQPSFLPAVENLGRAYRGIGKYGESEKCFKRILKKHPKNAMVLEQMGLTLQSAGNHKSAAQFYRKAIQKTPNQAHYHYNLAHSLLEAGDTQGALKNYRNAIAIKPNYSKAYHGISYIKKFAKGDDDILKMLDFMNAQGNSAEDNAYYGYALGKALNDIGNYQEAFSYYEQANNFKLSQNLSYDVNNTLYFFDAIIKQLTPSNIRPATAANKTNKPIFIVGMPRSGTTLVEQILSSHSLIHGAGELDLLSDSNKLLENIKKKPYPNFLQDPDLDVDIIANAYIDGINKISPKAKHVTDKMPGNFRYLGLINKAMPNAIIIHCTRNPIDTCLSCYVNNFTDGIQYSNSQKSLAAYYNGYKKMMKHWHDILPAGKIFDINYEDLVSNPEARIRELLTHCGLDWEDSCLQPHKTKRSVSTASFAQVRTAINTNSIEKWRRYENNLTPLLENIDLT